MSEQEENMARAIATRLFKEAETKRVFQEALDAWLDKKFSNFGRWSATGIMVAIFGAFVVFVMWSQGYHKP